MANDDVPKYIKKLIESSANGDYKASFQLSKVYSEELSGIPKNLKKAEEYKRKCASQLEGYKFRLSSIKLVNYKGFDNLTLPLSKGNTTILVGNNGSGKSSVLDGIQKTLSHISSRLTTRSYNGDQIDEIEIKNNSNFSTINPTYQVNNDHYQFELSQSRSAIELKMKSKYTEINELCNLLRQSNSAISNFSFPLLASYNVERANDVTTKDIEDSDEINGVHTWDKSKAYSKSLTGRADFRLFFRWFKEQVEAENDDNVEFQKLKEAIKFKEKELNSPLIKAILEEAGESDSARLYIQNSQEELKILKEKLNNSTNISNKSLEVVKNAIYSFLPGFRGLKLKRNPLDLTLEKSDITLSVLQLSQGEKSLLALVADIARRLVLLNPTASNPLDGTGIVLIDEIDLHLHPSWQQKVIIRLEETFPNIQFIVTTHSPQVCHTKKSESIWLLKDGKKYKAPKGVKGAVSSWVLKNLFLVDERPENEITELLKRYKELVYDDKYHCEEAKVARGQLIDNFGADYDELVSLDLYIENREWEKSFEKDS
ncbi:retron Ec78 anti-phage system effector ATPase PtuA [Pseudoalteromonas sp. BZP1]|uniref:retron Ec78 anti-phage system effector ATPase PtuA n=1 Tax=unclassified Pseudoalteromonas TaxID=194690 RepID=UPI0032C3F39C